MPVPAGYVFNDMAARIERARLMGEANRTHGHASQSRGVSREWNSWCAMKKRCTNPNHEAFERYAGRAIGICERWLNSFENFFADMGTRPPGKTLERIDNDKGYEPGNCEWATPKKQMANTRANVMVTICGVTKSLPNWCLEPNATAWNIVRQRIRHGWEPERAIFTPRCDAGSPERRAAALKAAMSVPPDQRIENARRAAQAGIAKRQA